VEEEEEKAGEVVVVVKVVLLLVEVEVWEGHRVLEQFRTWDEGDHTQSHPICEPNMVSLEQNGKGAVQNICDTLEDERQSVTCVV